MSNILLCEDLVKRFGNSMNKVKGLIIKVYLKKAYDSIEWEFFMSYYYLLTSLVASLSALWHVSQLQDSPLLINGSPKGIIEAKRGLRQGDPMFSLIFILCMVYLTRIFTYIGRCKTPSFSLVVLIYSLIICV